MPRSLFSRVSLRPVCLLACWVALAAGCTKPATDPGDDQIKTIRIGVIGKSQSNDVFLAAHAGANQAAIDLADEYGVKVEIDLRTPNNEDAVQQANYVRALADAGFDGIAVSCSHAETVAGAIDDAVKSGATVVCFDSDAPDSMRMAVYGTDDMECGKVILDELAKAMGETGTVAILAGNASAPNLQKRVQGVREALKAYPNMKELDEGVFYHQETPEDAAIAVNGAMDRYGDQIDGWAMIGGWPLFTDNALTFEPGSVKIVACDALPKQLDYLRSGHVQVLMAQDCFGWGYESVRLILEKVVRGNEPKEAKIVDPLERVTVEDVDEFAAKWVKWVGPAKPEN
jgi:ribose transport system substrate-binding protein